MNLVSTYTGVVQKGTKRAAALGFPTINIPLGDPSVSGIYAAIVRFGDNSHHAVVYANQNRKILEAHMLDSSLDLYGKEIAVELLEKIRDDKTFESDNMLQATIADDVEKARKYFKDV